MKCGECAHQAFGPVTPQVIQDHLQGHHVIGVYPLLRNERCHLLAIDFDKGSWADDVGAFAETCRAVGIATAVELSRSGNGAHAWFFFDEPIPAAIARRLGCYLLTETMSRRPELGMDSYDLLFPNQDTMPRGGFGNLIALPLQREARERGNTVFVDDALRPHPDQWAFLAGAQRIPAATAELVAREAQRQGRVLGVRFAAVEEDEAPWTRSPSGRMPRTAVLEPLPETVRMVHGQRLFIEKAGLPAGFVTELRRLAAFQNPEFYKKQAMHLGTRGTPRVVTCAEESGAFLSLPRGCEADAVALVAEWGGRPTVEDQRVSGEPIEVEFRGELTEVQSRAAAAILPHDIGIVVAPPGTGKTVLGAALIAKRAVSTLVLVHRKLQEQATHVRPRLVARAQPGASSRARSAWSSSSAIRSGAARRLSRHQASMRCTCAWAPPEARPSPTGRPRPQLGDDLGRLDRPPRASVSEPAVDGLAQPLTLPSRQRTRPGRPMRSGALQYAPRSPLRLQDATCAYLGQSLPRACAGTLRRFPEQLHSAGPGAWPGPCLT